MEDNRSWVLPLIFGITGILLLIDSTLLRFLLPTQTFIEGALGAIFIILAVMTYRYRTESDDSKKRYVEPIPVL